MKKEEVNDLLNKIGKTVFVEHFAALRDYARGGSSAACLRALRRVGYSENARRTRCSKAKAIFRARREQTALRICRDSRIPDSAQRKAAALLRRL